MALENVGKAMAKIFRSKGWASIIDVLSRHRFVEFLLRIERAIHQRIRVHCLKDLV